MTPSDQARALVLSRIRAALGVTSKDRKREQAVEGRLHNHPRGTIPGRARADHEALLDLMITMLKSQGAETTRATTPEEAVRVIVGDLGAHNLPSILRMGNDPMLGALPWDTAPLLERLSGRAVPDDRAALSGAVTAVAETGTLVLVSGADNPTTLAFLPEVHFILVRAGDVVGSYEAAFDRLRAIYGEGSLPRTVNLISGPSRTADIEQTIVRGAHGPKRLHVVILG
ncbi:LutC/YkgG family protein [Methyloceanibacter sp.]|uniref:LutC/YkgG family protein n=1 Tax=Methyloceanibacter sp. TaxID=1965321 RepID=UPI003D6CC235